MSRLIGLSPLRELLRESAHRLKERHQGPSYQHGDLYELADAFLIVFDAPGVNEVDIHIRYVDNAVRVRMERFRPPRSGFSLVAAKRRMSFDGHVMLPDEASVDPEAAMATLRSNGTVHIRLPKVAPSPEAESVTTTLD